MIPLSKIAQPAKNKRISQAQTGKQHFSVSKWLLLLALTLVALVPRLILVNQLDLVTDEIIYIMGGKIYLPLLLHLRPGSNLWAFNYEHPPFVKLLIGLAIYLNAHLGNMFSVLLAARIPSIISGTLLIVAIYWLGRAPFGNAIALLAALCLAVSPWLVYFSALAYLDMPMTALVTIAYLLLWPALQQPRLYPLSASLMGLAIASKYTAALALPAMLLFISYYFLAIRPYVPAQQRPPLPWRWWLAALALLPITFFVADPAIWRHPASLLEQSVLFEWHHSINGHLTFLAGQYSEHVPHWAVLYILIAKLSVLVTLPALFFIVIACIQVVRYHLHIIKLPTQEVTRIIFLLIWLVSLVGMFSLLNIVVGTHYLLPLAPPLSLAGTSALFTLLRYRRNSLLQYKVLPASTSVTDETLLLDAQKKQRLNLRAALVLALLTILLVAPHLLGLTTVYAAEGYTSELFHGENSVLQVAYPAYREAGLWLMTHTRTSGTIGLVALPGTLNHGDNNISWYSYNRNILGRLSFSEAHPGDASFPYDYLVWPMHLIQRGYAVPSVWRSHIVHSIMGGSTTYCFILAQNPATIIF